jgi:hypothetical protein
MTVPVELFCFSPRQHNSAGDHTLKDLLSSCDRVIDDQEIPLRSIALFKQKDKTDWGRKDLPDDAGVVLNRLADQINFFNKRSKQNQNRYKWLKATTFIAAAVIAISGALALPIWTVPVLGGAIIVIESILSTSSSHQNWLAYRRTCEALKHEKYLYLANAGPYRDVTDRNPLLAERTESILLADHETWLAIQTEQVKKLKTTTAPNS